MWDRLRQWLTPGAKQDSAGESHARADPKFTWYDVGPPNPFPMRILDVRPLTQTLFAVTTDMQVAAKYSALRASDGRDLVTAPIADSVRIPTSLRLHHNGTMPEGVAYKADSMDVKWDIYIYDSVFLFARSWTGELVYRGFTRVDGSDLVIHEIECARVEHEIAPSHVYFLIASHGMRHVLPHRVPEDTPRDDEKIAVRSFSLFGRFAWYATYEDITGLSLSRKQSVTNPDSASTNRPLSDSA